MNKISEPVRGTMCPFHTLDSKTQDSALQYLATRFIKTEPIFGSIVYAIALEELKEIDSNTLSNKEKHEFAFSKAELIVQEEFMKYLNAIKSQLIEEKVTFVLIDTNRTKKIRGVVISDIISKDNLHGACCDVHGTVLEPLIDFLDKLDEPLEEWVRKSDDPYVRIKFAAADDKLVFDYILNYCFDAYRVCKHRFRGFVAEVTHPVSQTIAVSKKNMYILRVLKFDQEGILAHPNRETTLSVNSRLYKKEHICMFEKIAKGGPGAALIVKVYDDNVRLQDYSVSANHGIDILDIQVSTLDDSDTKIDDESGKSEAERVVDFVVSQQIEHDPMFKALHSSQPKNGVDQVSKELKDLIMSRLSEYISSGMSLVGRVNGEYVFVALNSFQKARDVRLTNQTLKEYNYISPALKVYQDLWPVTGFTSCEGIYTKVEFLAVKDVSLAPLLFANYICVNASSSLRAQISGIVTESTHMRSLCITAGVSNSFILNHVSYSKYDKLKTVTDKNKADGINLCRATERDVSLVPECSAASIVLNLERTIGHF